MSAMEYEPETGGRYEEEARYGRDRSASPRGAKRDDGYRGSRQRSASPGMNSRGPTQEHGNQDERDAEAANTGTNLFVTGIAPRLVEEDVIRMFSKYGEVKHCAIMKDPHSHESRGFGFVEMFTTDQAEAAKDGLSGEIFEGRTLSIEKARRARPRTPTPGKYFGPPKKEDRRDGGRFNDRRGYGGGRSDRRDERGYHDRRYDDRREDRYDDRRGGGSGGGYGRREDRYDDRRGGGDRYAREDRYGGGRDDRRGDRGDTRGARYDTAHGGGDAGR